MRVQLNARNRAFQFEAAAGEKILYAGLRAHAALPYECATGTCGTCKARLVEGRIDDGWPAAPGKKYDDFQLSYALDMLRGKMTVSSVVKSAEAN